MLLASIGTLLLAITIIATSSDWLFRGSTWEMATYTVMLFCMSISFLFLARHFQRARAARKRYAYRVAMQAEEEQQWQEHRQSVEAGSDIPKAAPAAGPTPSPSTQAIPAPASEPAQKPPPQVQANPAPPANLERKPLPVQAIPAPDTFPAPVRVLEPEPGSSSDQDIFTRGIRLGHDWPDQASPPVQAKPGPDTVPAPAQAPEPEQTSPMAQSGPEPDAPRASALDEEQEQKQREALAALRAFEQEQEQEKEKRQKRALEAKKAYEYEQRSKVIQENRRS